MCGIIGVFGDVEEDAKNFRSVLRTLRHRGPDESGILQREDHLLGHQRLSIIDVKTGRQPFRSPEGRVALVCNGEIYNYKRLKRELADQYPFATRSDSEVIIPIYLNEDTRVAERLDGMFSFIISGPETYYVARDPLGIKPLYYGKDDHRTYFASEVKALTEIAEHIEEFPPGHFYHPEGGFTRYYQLHDPDDYITDANVAIAAIRRTLRESVRKRLMADVPVGVFLSGGLDSSIIAALMKEDLDELHSFSVGLPGSPDLKAARKVAEHLGTIHHEHVYSEEEMREVLSGVIYHLESYDAALIRSSVPCYFVSKLARQFVKVILSGEGSDELFCGYSYLYDYDDPQALQNESIRILNGLHNINLQRVDRMSMAHALEGRVPFLDTEFVETVLRIDPKLKMYETFGIEKWLLRKAFEDLLPHDIVWRDKMEFAQGAGSSTVFEDSLHDISDADVEAAKAEGAPVNTREELLYYNIFKGFFDHPDVEGVIGKWQGELH